MDSVYTSLTGDRERSIFPAHLLFEQNMLNAQRMNRSTAQIHNAPAAPSIASPHVTFAAHLPVPQRTHIPANHVKSSVYTPGSSHPTQNSSSALRVNTTALPRTRSAGIREKYLPAVVVTATVAVIVALVTGLVMQNK